MGVNEMTSDLLNSPMLEVTEEQAQAALLRFDDGLTFPMSTEHAARLLRDRAEFDVSAKWLRNQAATGAVQRVETEGGLLRWSASAVCHAGLLADCFRRWLPGQRHAAKLSGIEAMRNAASGSGQTIFEDLDKVALRDLVVSIERSESQERRHVLTVGLLEKLRVAGVSLDD